MVSSELLETRDHVQNDATVFNNIDAVRMPTLQHVLQQHRLRRKQRSRCHLRETLTESKVCAVTLWMGVCATLLPGLQTCRYRARILDCIIFTDLYILLSVTENIGHGYLCNSPRISEVGFRLSETRCRGRNAIGQRAIINVPGQCVGNVTHL